MTGMGANSPTSVGGVCGGERERSDTLPELLAGFKPVTVDSMPGAMCPAFKYEDRTCMVETSSWDDLLVAMQNGNRLSASGTSGSGEKETATFDLTGFSAAYGRAFSVVAGR